MKVNIITIGDEILIGQIIDTNSAWMGEELNKIGAEVKRIISIGDDRQQILDTLDTCLRESDVVLITGGLGPTKDDITKKTIAEFFNVGMRFDQPTFDRIEKLFERWGRSTTAAHREQCYMPENATLLFNKMGTAPGMWFEHLGKVVISMPGVPYEMKYLMSKEVLPRLKKQFPGQPIAHRTILTIGEGESRIADRIQPFLDDLPPHIKIAYLPSLGKVRLRLTGKGQNAARLEEELDRYASELKDQVSELVYGEGRLQLQEAIGQLLLKYNKTIVTAESCTGGYIAHMLTSVPGSSAYYQGSTIAYSNTIKTNHLKVSPDTLKIHGAVSEQTVREMVRGALDLYKTDLAVAISGIAGPGGGSPEKPVGTVWIAVGDENHVQTQLISAGKNRIKNIEYSAVKALDEIRKFILSQYAE